MTSGIWPREKGARDPCCPPWPYANPPLPLVTWSPSNAMGEHLYKEKCSRHAKNHIELIMVHLVTLPSCVSVVFSGKDVTVLFSTTEPPCLSRQGSQFKSNTYTHTHTAPALGVLQDQEYTCLQTVHIFLCPQTTSKHLQRTAFSSIAVCSHASPDV